uniref:Uncharacterized protein n=1 Tax=Lutzomyia longipalpis TaxID=7200 RepID=A0A1B0GJU8_LUTLO
MERFRFSTVMPFNLIHFVIFKINVIRLIHPFAVDFFGISFEVFLSAYKMGSSVVVKNADLCNVEFTKVKVVD